MSGYIAIAVGGAIGSVARAWVTATVGAAVGAAFPWGTLLINILGSLVIGIAAAIPTERFGMSPETRIFLMTGLCGGFTTFSAFSLQTFELLSLGRWSAGGVYVTASVLLCVVATWLGYQGGAALTR